jgi:alkylated DNA repair protein (DNA oxidative demethylase)
MPHPTDALTDLFDGEPRELALAPGAVVLCGFARAIGGDLLSAVEEVTRVSPFRRMVTPGGWRMSVAMTNCGDAGWVTDRTGYRYDSEDPDCERAWPAMPTIFCDLARRAADRAGFTDFMPDSCLINRYEPGSRLSLHQDRNERDFGQPIVSVSLGLGAIFLWGGQTRAERPRRVPLVHGDIVVWGGEARLTFHGVDTLREGDHPATGRLRYNLTFRRAR